MRLVLFVIFLFIGPLSALERQIALLVRPDFFGELSFAYRIKAACQHLNWKADVIFLSEADQLKKKKYRFVINLSPGTYDPPKCKNYLAVFHPKHHYFRKGQLHPEYSHYDGYLLSFLPTTTATGRQIFANRPYLLWYPTAPHSAYVQVNPTHLFYICCTWGNRAAQKYREFLSLVEKEPYARFYGNELFREIYPHAYQGPIPFEDNSFAKRASSAGVALILHSEDHLLYGIPSGRIFESIAASAVIICDQNSFVRKHFGDSVLYIDTSRDAYSIYHQIHQHMQWIQNHKEEALKKAKKAHDIFRKQFLLENQLLSLEEFHDQ